MIQPSGPRCWISSPVWERRACYGHSRRSPRPSAVKVTLSLTATAFRPAKSRQLHVKGWPKSTAKSLTDRKHVGGHLALSQSCFSFICSVSSRTPRLSGPVLLAAQLVSMEVCATFTLAQAQRALERTDAPVFLILNASPALLGLVPVGPELPTAASVWSQEVDPEANIKRPSQIWQPRRP